MLLEMSKPIDALKAYETDLERHTNRFNGLYGAGFSAKKAHDLKRARTYYRQLLAISNSSESDSPELLVAEKFVKGR
jgi:hypothetical protein